MAKKTVYIIGAGASYEAKLPTGEKLKHEISKLFDNRIGLSPVKKQLLHSEDFIHHFEGFINKDIRWALEIHSRNQSDDLYSYYRECQHISENMPLAISIDNFIDSDPNNHKLALCGKIAIVKSILKAEKKSSFNFDKYSSFNSLDFNQLENTWYLSFFKTLTENCSIENLTKRFKDITLIIFNYDRCIEHFLLHALKSYYKLATQQAADIISNLQIIHPYGTVGSLEWDKTESETTIEFGGELNPNQLISYAQRIRTFTEGTSAKYKKPIIKSMRYTERLVFLGFSFHPLNMKFLRAQSDEGYAPENDIKCFATAYGASNSDIESIKESIKFIYSGSILDNWESDITTNIEHTTCSQLFKDYSRSLGYSDM